MKGRRQFTREFKVEAVRLVKEGDVSVARAARDLDVHENLLGRWVRELSADPQFAFPGKGVMKPEQAEIERLRKEVAKLKMERDILKKRPRPISPRSRREVRLRGEAPRGLAGGPDVRAALGVSRSGFYAWLARPRRRRSVEDERLGSQVRQSFLASDRTYGARRVWHDLLALGERCGLHRVERLMRGQALRSRPRRRGLPKDTGERTGLAENILDRQFQADAPNQKWVADFTYLWTTEGWLYVAAVLDLYSRRIVGWSMQSRMTSQLVADALVMAVWRRGRPQELLHHRLGRRSRRGVSGILCVSGRLSYR